MSKQRDSFIFFRSFYESAQILPPEQQLQFYNAINEWSLNQKTIPMDKTVKAMFGLIKPVLDNNRINWENGCKGGRPKNGSKKPSVSEKNNPRLNNKEKGGYENPKSYKDKDVDVDVDVDVELKDIVVYLNDIVGSNFKISTTKTKSLINARLNEGYTIDDFKKVIDRKFAEWHGTKQDQYLRPLTLFGANFESYVNQRDNHTSHSNNGNDEQPCTYEEY